VISAALDALVTPNESSETELELTMFVILPAVEPFASPTCSHTSWGVLAAAFYSVP